MILRKRKILILLWLVIFLWVGVYFSYKYYQDYQKLKKQRIQFEKRKAGWNALKKVLNDEIAGFKGEAGVIVKDLDMNWEFSFNKDRLFPSASLVKIPIMAACFNAVQEGRIKLEDIVKIRSSDKVSGSGLLKNMKSGTGFSIEKLIELMISNSDNTATNMLINQLGFDYFNNFFQRIGLKNTNLSRKMMDFKLRKIGIENYTTPEDVAFLLEKIYCREFLDVAKSERCLKLLKQQNINDRIPAKLPANTLVVHKTGLERHVCHDAGIVFTDKGNFIIVALTKRTNSNSASSKEFIAKVSLFAYKYFEQL